MPDNRLSRQASSPEFRRIVKSAASSIKPTSPDAARPWTGSRSFKVVEFDTEAFKPFSIGESHQASRVSSAARPTRIPSGKRTTSILKKGTVCAPIRRRFHSNDLSETSPIIDETQSRKSIPLNSANELKDPIPLNDASDKSPLEKSQNTLSREIRGRNAVPHDFPLDKFSHAQHCSQAPPGMITKSLAYSSRCRKTTFGKSNRIVFLRQLRDDEGQGRVRPPYPPAYHGPCGEGQQFALGLTLAGSAESDRILGPICTYGKMDRKFDHPQCPTSLPLSAKTEKGKRICSDSIRAYI